MTNYKGMYIGKRYIPKNEGLWSINKEYESLSIVTYNDDGYTSKIDVPQGIDILNEMYWVKTGNYNSNLVNQQSEIIAARKGKTDLVTKINEIDTTLSENTNKIAPLNPIQINGNNLRIAYWYTYGMDQDKLNLLKSLGFNCIIVSRAINSFLSDVSQAHTFLDFLYSNGVTAILRVNVDNITGTNGGDIANEQAWIRSLNSHDAVIGYGTYDEPMAGKVAIDLQITAYQNVKAVTSKPVFVSDYFGLDLQDGSTRPAYFYTPDSFDIYLFDVYLNTTTLMSATSNERKEYLFAQIIGLKNKPTKYSPKKIIPVLPFFTQTGYGLMNETILKDYLDVFSLFDFTDFSVFAFDSHAVPDAFPDTLDSNSELRSLCKTFWSTLYKRNQEISIIRPRGFNLQKTFVSNTNMEYNSTTKDKLYVTINEQVGAVVTKIDIDQANKDLHMISVVSNSADTLTRKVNHSVSFDGVTYEQIYTKSFNATLGGLLITSTHTIPANVKTVYCKYELDFNDNPNGGSYEDSVGFFILANSTF